MGEKSASRSKKNDDDKNASNGDNHAATADIDVDNPYHFYPGVEKTKPRWLRETPGVFHRYVPNLGTCICPGPSTQNCSPRP